MTGRILFMSALAYVAFRYIKGSNKRHQALADRVGTTEVLPPSKPASETLAKSSPASIEVPKSDWSKAGWSTSKAVEPTPGL